MKSSPLGLAKRGDTEDDSWDLKEGDSESCSEGIRLPEAAALRVQRHQPSGAGVSRVGDICRVNITWSGASGRPV